MKNTNGFLFKGLLNISFVFILFSISNIDLSADTNVTTNNLKEFNSENSTQNSNEVVAGYDISEKNNENSNLSKQSDFIGKIEDNFSISASDLFPERSNNHDFITQNFSEKNKLNANDQDELSANDFINNFDIAENSSSNSNDTTKTSNSETNDLNFDDIETKVNENDPNMGLFPSKISIVESALWSKKGLFRDLGIVGELTPEQRAKEIGWRRTFLTIHQTTGIITLGLMLASCYTGQMWLDGKSNTPDLHKALVGTTIIGYSLTGLMAMLTPPPSIRRDEISTITIHKALAWLHVSGMILTPILGSMIENSTNYYQAAHFHQASAYITTAIYAAAMAVILIWD